MGEHVRGADDVAGLAGAGGGVAQVVPASGEDRESAFAQASQRSKKHVVGAVVDGEFPAIRGLLDRHVNALASAFVPAVGQGR